MTGGQVLSDSSAIRVFLTDTMFCRRALGWLAAERDVPLEELRLKSMIPSSDRAGVHLAFDYSQFLLDDRQVSPYTQGTQTLLSQWRTAPSML